MLNRHIVFRLVLLALFLFSYQTTTIHSKHHFIDELSECQVCKAAKELGAAQHETAFLQVSETIAVEVNEVKEKKITKSSYDLMQSPVRCLNDFDGLTDIQLYIPFTGYFSTAPPYTFS